MPCIPSPCGPNSQCREIGSTAVCSCLPNYIGRAPNCRPECTINSECPANHACINERCKDPCPGSCGLSAYCNVINHSPVCTCANGYQGDPFSGCYPIPSKILFYKFGELYWDLVMGNCGNFVKMYYFQKVELYRRWLGI